LGRALCLSHGQTGNNRDRKPAYRSTWKSGDLRYRRKILGSDGPFIRRTAKTRSWERAEDFKRKLEEEYEAKQQGLEEASRPKPALVTVEDAVSRFLNSKRNENLADSTLDKLTTIFEKQFLAWATSYGFIHITEITTAAWKAFVTLGPMAPSRRKRNRSG
jgi:integrase/recombinase XerD